MSFLKNLWHILRNPQTEKNKIHAFFFFLSKISRQGKFSIWPEHLQAIIQVYSVLSNSGKEEIYLQILKIALEVEVSELLCYLGFPDLSCAIYALCLVASVVFNSAIPWTVAHQAPLSRPEHWSRLPCSLPGDPPNPQIEPRSPALQADSLPAEPPGKPMVIIKAE